MQEVIVNTATDKAKNEIKLVRYGDEFYVSMPHDCEGNGEVRKVEFIGTKEQCEQLFALLQEMTER